MSNPNPHSAPPAYPQPERLSFPVDEVRQPWLATLPDAYLTTDQGVSEEIQHEERQGRELTWRHFNFIERPCAEGEDVFYSRRKDVLTHLRKYKAQAPYVMLPFYGVKSKHERREREAGKAGSIHPCAEALREFTWTSLAERMKAFDQTNRDRKP